MRQRVALAALLAATAPAAADAPKKAPAPAGKPAAASPKLAPIDITKMRDKLDVYRDDAGHYLVVPREMDDTAGEWVFYGDGKQMYQQRVFGTGSSDEGADYTVWAPRVTQQAGAQITIPGAPPPAAPGEAKPAARKPMISCDPNKERALVQLPSDQARSMIARAAFLPPLWQRGTHLIARDDDGTYYFVDAFREEAGGGGYRLFLGKKDGKMKEQVLTGSVSDPAGDVFTTADGSLKTFGDASDKPPVWRHGDKVTELTPLDLTDGRTRLIIYRDFNIYGALGTPCD